MSVGVYCNRKQKERKKRDEKAGGRRRRSGFECETSSDPTAFVRLNKKTLQSPYANRKEP